MYGFNPNYQQLIRVNGIEGAKAYQVMMPNTTVALFDANEDYFYIKSLDNAGFPSLRTFKFEEVSPVTAERSDYVSRKEMEDYVKQLIQSATTETRPTSNNGYDKGQPRSNSQPNVSK